MPLRNLSKNISCMYSLCHFIWHLYMTYARTHTLKATNCSMPLPFGIGHFSSAPHNFTERSHLYVKGGCVNNGVQELKWAMELHCQMLLLTSSCLDAFVYTCAFLCLKLITWLRFFFPFPPFIYLRIKSLRVCLSYNPNVNVRHLILQNYTTRISFGMVRVFPF